MRCGPRADGVAEHTGRPPVPLVWMPRRDATGAVRVARCTSGVDVSLREALDLFVGSETFEGLLLAHDRPIHARAETGEAFVVAGLAVALDAPVLAVAPGPHEADALVEDLEAFLPDDVAVLPAWEALPYEGISPAPDVAARRAAAVRRLRDARGATVVVAPPLAAMQGLVPTLGTTPPLELVAGRELPPDALAERLVELGY